MSKDASKKRVERRKRPRRKGNSPVKATPKQAPLKPVEADVCYHCSKDLKDHERSLFVEEEIGRVFCSEECIASYFAPDIKRLETEYLQMLSSSDLTPEEREQLNHLRWVTLDEPDEVWREKTLAGDYRYTLISEFKPSERPIWYVCICLFLRGEPSFLYLAFPTRNVSLANHYRRGEQVQLVKPKKLQRPTDDDVTDGLADGWTEDETIRAQYADKRSPGDIPREEFELFNDCLEETLENPDEIWTLEMEPVGDKAGKHLYHFIRYYSEEHRGLWYVVIAREGKEPDQIEIVESFPTRDPKLVEWCRKGEREMGVKDTGSSSGHMVH